MKISRLLVLLALALVAGCSHCECHPGGGVKIAKGSMPDIQACGIACGDIPAVQP